jgi:uncharacterized DUF497 family protein
MRRFEWDPVKAARNLRKHGVAFDDVVPVFDDDNAIDELDADPDEERFRMTGLAPAIGVVVVIYAERGRNRIRIISARRATKHEVETYRQG